MTVLNTSWSRRALIRTMTGAGGGMILGFHLPGAVAAVTSPRPWTTPTDGNEINAWLSIDPGGMVTIRVPHTEQGQGGMTSVAMLIAEELDVPWDNVRAVFADINRHFNRGREYVVTSTHGSQLVRQQHPHIMQAGASARERLREAAAQAWVVDRAEVTARQGMLSAGSRRAGYAEFATAAAAITLAEEPAIKTPEQWWLLGKPTPRLDVPVKVNGSAQYAIDTRLPGMVYAAVKCCPVPWGGLRGYDVQAILGRSKGVIAVVELKAVPGKTFQADMQNGVAVVADTWHRARTALEQLPIEWDFGPEGEVSNATQAAEARRLLDQPGELGGQTGGDALAMINASGNTVAAEYHRPYETHARMEPINATVSVAAERVDVWSPAQDQTTPLMLVADQLQRDPEDIHVHTPFIGGAFGSGGGRSAVTRQAAEISRQVGRPVQVIWSREEDIMQDKQRPPVHIRLSAALGADGLPAALFSRAVWFTHPGSGGVGSATADVCIVNMPYRVPHRRHERHNPAAHVPTGTHRAPGTNQNAFVMEQFVDEMALAGGWDPLEWRLEMTRGLESWQRVLLKLKEVSGFTTDLPRGEGMGIGIVEDHGSICAACATVSVSQSGQLKVDKVDVVINSGYIINPRGSTEQLEGAVCWELSHALYGGLDLRNGRFQNCNFDTYKLMRIHEMPEVEVHFALSQDGWWGGVGEPGGPPVPPAVANAIWFATGKRVRSTPISGHDLSWS